MVDRFEKSLNVNPIPEMASQSRDGSSGPRTAGSGARKPQRFCNLSAGRVVMHKTKF
jgi:hypothetical protein